jgi:hypothetical protein
MAKKRSDEIAEAMNAEQAHADAEAKASEDAVARAARAVLVENPGSEPTEAVADDPVNRDAQTLFVKISGDRYEHCATTADGRWVYRKS